MADVARIARPWLPLLKRPMRSHAVSSPYIGLCYGYGHGHGHSRGISATAACRAPGKSQSRKSRQTTDRARRREQQQMATATLSLLLPYTIVPPPVWRFPRSPVKFAQMVWLLAKNRLQAFGSLLGVYFVSMRSKWFGLPRFRAKKATSIPAAKALHAQMSEAVAAGDKDTLRRICTNELFQTLAGAIDSRPARIRTEWELVRYDNRLRYPRVADFRVMYQPVGDSKRSLRLLKQAVVSISSVQRLTRYDDANGGQKVPGSERERHMVEHIVLQAEIKDGTFEAGPWQIWGTLSEMSFETLRADAAIFEDTMAQGRS